MARGLFITGTGTGVGKTYVAGLVARALVAAGKRVGVYKPVASGCEFFDGRLVSPDAVAMWEGAGRPGTIDRVCPQMFAAPQRAESMGNCFELVWSIGGA
jgi:dethiobiotin synthetase